jgi:hypothetical protein
VHLQRGELDDGAPLQLAAQRLAGVDAPVLWRVSLQPSATVRLEACATNTQVSSAGRAPICHSHAPGFVRSQGCKAHWGVEAAHQHHKVISACLCMAPQHMACRQAAAQRRGQVGVQQRPQQLRLWDPARNSRRP